MNNELARSSDVDDDDVGQRPSPASVVPPAPLGAREGAIVPSVVPGFATLPAPAPLKCEELFELFRGGAGSVHLGRLHDGKTSTQLVAMRRLANLPTRELESAITRAQRVTHPRLTKMLGMYQHEDAWYLASEYASGVTLFELGQTAVKQRTPLSAPVAVRIVLDALTVTAEAEQLVGNAGGAGRCLYPESIWVSDSGKLFMSEILVAPVLARTTTGASYVAVTAGMSAAASDVRAAAVELARLACGRLMNGNPASWQTRELPHELSELLARAVSGGPGAETPAAFAGALAVLDPQLIADRETVREELERLMGPERLRRREQLEALEEKAVDSDTTRVFRAAPAPGVPDFGQGPITMRPPDLAAARARRSTAPPPKPAVASRPTNPTPTIPAPPLTPAPLEEERDSSPISGVWREAHERMGVPGRRSRTRRHSELEPTPGPVLAPALAVAPQPKAPQTSKRVVVVSLIVLTVSALFGAAWFSLRRSSSHPDAAQHAP
ncbi:MAG TPA: hypothetical protein VJV79_40995 [Polyangiaceae bacterium]|nr:hypothetical protein [Polyangiaceae bacterium]